MYSTLGCDRQTKVLKFGLVSQTKLPNSGLVSQTKVYNFSLGSRIILFNFGIGGWVVKLQNSTFFCSWTTQPPIPKLNNMIRLLNLKL